MREMRQQQLLPHQLPLGILFLLVAFFTFATATGPNRATPLGTPAAQTSTCRHEHAPGQNRRRQRRQRRPSLLAVWGDRDPGRNRSIFHIISNSNQNEDNDNGAPSPCSLQSQPHITQTDGTTRDNKNDKDNPMLLRIRGMARTTTTTTTTTLRLLRGGADFCDEHFTTSTNNKNATTTTINNNNDPSAPNDISSSSSSSCNNSSQVNADMAPHRRFQTWWGRGWSVVAGTIMNPATGATENNVTSKISARPLHAFATANATAATVAAATDVPTSITPSVGQKDRCLGATEESTTTGTDPLRNETTTTNNVDVANQDKKHDNSNGIPNTVENDDASDDTTSISSANLTPIAPLPDVVPPTNTVNDDEHNDNDDDVGRTIADTTMNDSPSFTVTIMEPSSTTDIDETDSRDDDDDNDDDDDTNGWTKETEDGKGAVDGATTHELNKMSTGNDNPAVQNETNNNDSSSSSQEADNGAVGPDRLEQARLLRAQGKVYHDQGDYTEAAQTFGKAAHLLQQYHHQSSSAHVREERNDNDLEDDDGNNLTHNSSMAFVKPDTYATIIDTNVPVHKDLKSTPTSFDASESTGTFEDVSLDLLTLRLHESLCSLKAEDYVTAMKAASAVIDWSPSSSSLLVVPAPLRARALYRRAKTHVALSKTQKRHDNSQTIDEEKSDSWFNHDDAALSDAKAAAFLGDNKAVALYGKLLRANSGRGDNTNVFSENTIESTTLSTTKSPTPFASSTLLESLLSKSSSSGQGAEQSFLPSSLMSTMMGGLTKRSNGGNGDGIAKSIWNMVSQRMDDVSTQDTICRYLQGTSQSQLCQWASLAGFPLAQTHAARIAKFCHSVTPKLLKRLVKALKGTVYAVQLMMQSARVVKKYRMIIVIWLLLWWVQSALYKPFPISKRAMKRAAAVVAKTGVLAATAATTPFEATLGPFEMDSPVLSVTRAL